MKNEKHAQAYNLYFQTNLSQCQIAKLLDVDRRTIYNWLSEGKWRQQKKLAQHMPSKVVEQYYYMLASMNHEILSRAHQPYPLTHEAEQMRKVAVTIRHLKNKQTVNEAMESFTHLAEMISHEDPEFAAKLNPYIRKYIQKRIDVKFADLVSGDYTIDPSMDQMYDYEIRPEDDDDPNFKFEPQVPVTPATPGGQQTTTIEKENTGSDAPHKQPEPLPKVVLTASALAENHTGKLSEEKRNTEYSVNHINERSNTPPPGFDTPPDDPLPVPFDTNPKTPRTPISAAA